MRIILSTVGTSLFGKAKVDDSIVLALRGVPVSQKHTVQDYYRAAFQSILQYSEQDDFDLVRDCAETNCLSRLNLLDIDHLIFITTDTLDGLVTGEVVAEICHREWKCKTEVVPCPGLQVKDGAKLRLEGLAQFVRIVYGYIKKYQSEQNEIILNATGGYKATLTYLTLIGQLEGLPVCYINDYYNTLIYLPAAPLGYDTKPLETLHKQIGEARMLALYEGVSHKELGKWADQTVTELKRAYKQILVWEKDKVYLSIFAQIVYDRDVRKQISLDRPKSLLRIDDEI
jgi:putative CRISPR-associated protein (TIGR02619 family)